MLKFLSVRHRWIACFLLLAISASLNAEVVGWRTNPTGAYPDAVPPVDWSDESKVKWSTPLPDRSNATPVVVGKRVFALAEPFTLACMDADSGELLWKHENTLEMAMAGSAKLTAAQQATISEKRSRLNELNTEARGLRRKARKDPEAKKQFDVLDRQIKALESELAGLDKFSIPKTHNVNGYSSATPVTDGEHVYAFFGNGVAACYDMAGNRKWIKHVQTPTHNWGNSASPQLVGDRLIITVKDMIGLDANTGEMVWSVKDQFSFGSPVVADVGGQPVVVSALGDFIDPKSGRLLGNLDVKLLYNSPVVVDDHVYFIYENAVAYSLKRDAQGKIVAQEIWQSRLPNDRYYGTAALHGGHLFAVTRGGMYVVIDAGNGDTVKTGGVRGKAGNGNHYYASPVTDGKHVFYTKESGDISVFALDAQAQPAKYFKVDAMRATPVFAGSRVYIRAGHQLVCIEN